MQIHIHSQNVVLSDAFHPWAEERVQEILAAFADRLTRVEVHLSDQNAQKGGVDTRCVIEGRPRGLDPVAAEHLGEGPRVAFTGALEKLQRVLGHQSGKLAARRRHEER